MYQNVRLEKGLYHLTDKSFTQALEALDPSAQYADTPLESLDAYERQLKRFDIRISGPQCDRVEKFFTTTESAVLFPEFIRRAIRQGINTSILPNIAAVETRTDSSQYLGCTLTETTPYTTVTDQKGTLPSSEITEHTTPLLLKKYARAVQVSYEAIRRQRLDVLAVMLRGIGVKLAHALVKDAMTVLYENAASSSTTAGSKLAYADLAKLYGKFTNFEMTTLLASPAVIADILAMSQVAEMTAPEPGHIALPFGTLLQKSTQLDDHTIIGIDKNFALEMITGTELILETDKLIDSQVNLITVSIQTGFRPLTTEAIHVLEK